MKRHGAKPTRSPGLSGARPDPMAEAVAAYRQDRPADAARICADILKAAPDRIDALHMLGVIETRRRNLAEAEVLLTRAAGLAPGNGGVRINLAGLLRERGRHDEALGRYDEAAALGPVDAAVHVSRGLCLHATGRPAESLAAFQSALAVAPDHLESLNNSAIVLAELGRLDEALGYSDRAVAAHPAAGIAQRQRGFALASLNRHAEAVACFDRALAVGADDLQTLVNRGSSLRRLGRATSALADFDRVLALQPANREALNNRASLLRDLGRNTEAAETYRRLREHHPDHVRAGGNLLNAGLMACDWRDLETLGPSVAAAARRGDASDTPFAFLAWSTSPEDQLACAAAWTREKHPPVTPAVWTGERYRHDRIRLAYLSADFQNHPMAHLMGRLFETHDRDRFELTAISFGRNTGDPMRKRLEAAFDRFIDMEAASDRETAALVRELEIDIAVDRKGFTRDARTGIFAMRPAPVQVNYLAYPGTMGSPYMDYLIADPVIIPEGDDRFYSEKVVRLPDTYQATDDRRPIGETPTRADCGLPETGFVFCSFNNNYKILPPIFDIWMRLLGRVEGSVLWLYVKSGEAIGNLRREAAARGVDPDRLVFATHLGMAEHLARHRQADLFLDTFPYTSHTTASDALWAGLPVVTCAGRTFASRVAASLLSAVGLPELITTDLESYEALALKLALEPDRLAAVKARLAAQRTRWPLFDSDRFRRHLESAFETMHERQQQGLPPKAFDVPPVSEAP